MEKVKLYIKSFIEWHRVEDKEDQDKKFIEPKILEQ